MYTFIIIKNMYTHVYIQTPTVHPFLICKYTYHNVPGLRVNLIFLVSILELVAEVPWRSFVSTSNIGLFSHTFQTDTVISYLL